MQELQKDGIIANDGEIEELLTTTDWDLPKLQDRIVHLERQKKLRYFLRYPNVEDLLEDPDLLDELERTIANKDSDITKKMLQLYPNLTHEQLQNSIKSIRTRATFTKYIQYLPSKRTAMFCGLAILVLVIAYFLYRR